MKKEVLLAFLLFVTGTAFAYDVTTPSTISNIRWAVAGTTGTEANNNTCTGLNLDVTGDWVKGSKFTIYGGLFCNVTGSNATTYGVTGTGFVQANGGVAMFLSIGTQFYWTCSTNPSFGATCTVANAATLSQIGTPTIALIP
ncbi:MAG: hypothetical protein NT159_04060 [Proteobacteria bacterium]|nr:hypothetical protein [Pseudomonadota bacterium]